MDWSIIEAIVSALVGGGLVAIFTIPEKKASQRLDNAERLIMKYEPIIARLEQDIKEKDDKIDELTKRVNEQDLIISDLKTRMHTAELIAREDKALRCERISCNKRQPAINLKQLEKLVQA